MGKMVKYFHGRFCYIFRNSSHCFQHNSELIVFISDRGDMLIWESWWDCLFILSIGPFRLIDNLDRFTGCKHGISYGLYDGSYDEFSSAYPFFNNNHTKQIYKLILFNYFIETITTYKYLHLKIHKSSRCLLLYELAISGSSESFFLLDFSIKDFSSVSLRN